MRDVAGGVAAVADAPGPAEDEAAGRADALLAGARRLLGAEPRVVVIDGRSGSGKTTLATAIAARLGADILRLDDLYPGWDGLAAGSRAAVEAIRTGRAQHYDWHLGRNGATVSLRADAPLVVEGCGALTADALAAASGRAGRGRVWTVWLQCPAGVRRERALGRDGDTFAPHWDRWAAQEELQLRRAHPVSLAHEIVHAYGFDGTIGCSGGARPITQRRRGI